MQASGQLRAAPALPAGKNRGIRRLRGWLGLSAGLGVMAKEKNLLSLPGFELQLVQPVA